MKKIHLGNRVKELRKKKGFSQETLAEESGLNPRTVQRIENGKSNPTGDTIRRISAALKIDPSALLELTIKENIGYLIILNLSALFHLFMPFIGILVPIILWTSKKDRFRNVDEIGRELINFELNWTIMLVIIVSSLFLLAKIGVLENLSFSTLISVAIVMCCLNIVLIIYNTFRINLKKDILYFSLIKII